MKYRFIREQAPRYPVKLMCRLLQVSRSGYYAWRLRPPSRRQLANRTLLQEIRQVYYSSRSTYGSPRVHAELLLREQRCSRKRVARLMRLAGLVARRRRRYVVTTSSRPGLSVALNLLDRQFAPGQRAAWAADITYIPTAEGWLYLAVVLDLRKRLVLGLNFGTQLERKLVLGALRLALGRRQPLPGTLHHSDRGSQYCSQEYQAVLAEHGLIPSMSRPGNCYDNAVVESFFAILKRELLQDKHFATREEAQRAIFEYIEVFYNRQRLHSTLGYRTPIEYEKELQYA